MQQPRTGRRSFFSLERKLPILIGSLVACVLLATLTLVYIELRDSAVETATERLRVAAEELAAIINEGAAGRVRLLTNVAEDSGVVAVLRGDSAAREQAMEQLQRLRVNADSALPLPLQLRDRDGTVRMGAGLAATEAVESVPLPDPVLADSMLYGPSERLGERIVYWHTAPVRDGERIIGHVAQLRSLNTGGVGGRIEQLIGSGTQVYFANRTGGLWTSLDGEVIGDGPDLDILGQPFSYRRPDGSRYYGYALAVPNSSWAIVTQLPWETVLARSNDVVRRVAIVGLVLMILGGIAAWLLSRSVTRPIRELGRAADAIASGDYSRRTGIERDDEIGRLASSFDAMVAKVDTTHAELERRFAHAQALAAELEIARVEALQANRAKSDFLATMSHEIRTPINAVIGYTDLLDAGIAGELPPLQRNYVERIRLSSEHLITLVNDVLDFAKIESGQMRMSAEEHRLADTVGSVVDILHAPALERGIHVITECPPGLVYYADEHRVQQILLNLVSNALKFSPEGVPVHVTCETRASRAHSAHADGDGKRVWTCVTVADHGPGIPGDQLERIFEPFVQGTAGYTRPHGGTGLGLAIARSLAHLMGGDITLESTPGHGASFTLWLPQQPH